MTKKKKNKSPARVRYEKGHPVISFRIDKELRDRLKVVKEAEAKSNADLMRVAVGLLEVKVRAEGEIWQQGFNAGEESGFERAADMYAVPYHCCYCGKEIVVDTDDEKIAIRGYMHENGWAHAECQDRRHRR